MNYTYINKQDQLVEFVNTFENKTHLYIDLEFDKNHFRYGFNLCLMQLSDRETCCLIDPLAELDITTVFPLLTNPAIQKVSYAFGEDMRLLHHLGCFPKNVVDLATARTLLDLEHISLNKIIEQITGEVLQKSEQKSNWCERPLTQEQLHYAAMDVHYLPEIMKEISAKLKELKREDWLVQEVKALEEQNWGQENDYITIHEKEKKNYTLREWMRYIALINFREEVAARLNRPSYKVIDKLLIEQLAKKPTTLNNWTEQKRIHPSLKNKKTIETLRTLFRTVDQTIERENIPELAPARMDISREEKIRLRERRNELEQMKETFFHPIKEAIRDHYGVHFANYLLSNRKVESLYRGELSLLDYQKKIIQEEANKLNLNTQLLKLD